MVGEILNASVGKLLSNNIYLSNFHYILTIFFTQKSCDFLDIFLCNQQVKIGLEG